MGLRRMYLYGVVVGRMDVSYTGCYLVEMRGKVLDAD